LMDPTKVLQFHNYISLKKRYQLFLNLYYVQKI